MKSHSNAKPNRTHSPNAASPWPRSVDEPEAGGEAHGSGHGEGPHQQAGVGDGSPDHGGGAGDGQRAKPVDESGLDVLGDARPRRRCRRTGWWW